MGLPDIKVGDEILIRATVLRWMDGVGALVGLFSKTDQYEAWIAVDRIADVLLVEIPPEPTDGTWLLGRDPGGTNSRIFTRDDGEGHNDPDRRFHRRWWDVVAEEWIDWPEAVKRGADPNKRMTITEETADVR